MSYVVECVGGGPYDGVYHSDSESGREASIAHMLYTGTNKGAPFGFLQIPADVDTGDEPYTHGYRVLSHDKVKHVRRVRLRYVQTLEDL